MEGWSVCHIIQLLPLLEWLFGLAIAWSNLKVGINDWLESAFLHLLSLEPTYVSTVHRSHLLDLLLAFLVALQQSAIGPSLAGCPFGLLFHADFLGRWQRIRKQFTDFVVSEVLLSHALLDNFNIKIALTVSANYAGLSGHITDKIGMVVFFVF